MSRFTSPVAIVVLWSICVAVSGCARDAPAQRATGETGRIEAPFELDKTIPLELQMDADDKVAVVQTRSIRFEKVGDSLRAAVRVVERMSADAKCRLSVELVDGDGEKLGRAEGIFGTHKFMRLSQVSAEGELRLRLEPAEGWSNAARFALTLKRVPDAAPVTIGLRRTGPIADRRGNLSLKVDVLDPQGQPADAAYIRVWRAVEADDKHWQGAVISYPNNRRARGRLWHDPVSERTWEPYCDNSYGNVDEAHRVFDKLEPGEYRVSTVRALRDRDPDPTPIGVSKIIHLSRGQPRPSVTVRLEDGPSLRIVLRDGANGDPLDNADVLLTRANGFPLGAQRRSDSDGIVRYAHLASGTYRLRANKTVRGHRPADYVTADRIRVNVEPDRENRIEFALQPTYLAEAEIHRRWPWCVTGAVTDHSGKPMPGVEIRANCGQGTLRQTDITVTDTDGRYTLRPMPGMHIKNEETGEWGAGVQAATIVARKDGYYEANLCRQGGLLMAESAADRNANWGPTTAGVIVPSEPYRVDFVMLPAAVLEGRLLDEAGRPVTGQSVYLNGDELPPSSSVVAGGETDAQGSFTISSLPCKRHWFEVPRSRRNWLKSDPIDFAKPGIYEVELAFETKTPDSVTLTCKLLRAP